MPLPSRPTFPHATTTKAMAIVLALLSVSASTAQGEPSSSSEVVLCPQSLSNSPEFTLILSDAALSSSVTGGPELADLMGVISGPVSPNNGNTAYHDFTPELLDIGVTGIRNQSYHDASLDIDRMLDCSRGSLKRQTITGSDGSIFGICTNSRLGAPGLEAEFPCWTGCDSTGDFSQYMDYVGSQSDVRMDAIVANFEPFFRLGGENNTKVLLEGRVANDDVCTEMGEDPIYEKHVLSCKADPDGHSFQGPQTPYEEINWRLAAKHAVNHYISRYQELYPGTTKIQWLNIWTEFAGADSFYDQFKYSGGTSLLTSATVPTLEQSRAANVAAFAPFFAETARFLRTEFPDPKVKIGGPGFLDFSSLMKGEPEGGSIREVLTQVYNRGTGVPLDFVDMHLLAEDSDPEVFYYAPQAMRDLLDGVKGRCASAGCKRICDPTLGCQWDYTDVPWQKSQSIPSIPSIPPIPSTFFANTKIVIGAYEVNSNKGGVEHPELKRGKGAALQTGFYIAMQHSRLVERAYVYRSSDMQDSDGTSGGDLGMFYSLKTPSTTASYPYHKPKAHAMRLWSILARDYPLRISSDFPATRVGSSDLLYVLGGAKKPPAASTSSTQTASSTQRRGRGTTRDRAVLIANTSDCPKTFSLTYNTPAQRRSLGRTHVMSEFRSSIQQFQVGDVEQGRVNMASFTSEGWLTIGANSTSLVTFTLPPKRPL